MQPCVLRSTDACALKGLLYVWVYVRGTGAGQVQARPQATVGCRCQSGVCVSASAQRSGTVRVQAQRVPGVVRVQDSGVSAGCGFGAGATALVW